MSMFDDLCGNPSKRKKKSRILFQRFNDQRSFTVGRHIGSITGLSFKNETRGLPLLISSDDMGKIRGWSIDAANMRGKVLFDEAAHHKGINFLDSPSNSDEIVTASDDSCVKLWKLQDKPMNICRFEGHDSFVTCARFDDVSGELIVSCGLDRSAKIWHRTMREPVFTFRTNAPIYSVCFVPGETNLVLSAGQNGINFWDVRNHKSYQQMTNQFDNKENTNPFAVELENILPSLKFDKNEGDSPALELKASNYKKEEIFNKFTGTYERNFCGHKRESIIFSAVFSKDGQYIYSTGTDSRVKVWDVANQKGLWTLKKLGLNLKETRTRPSLSPCENYILCGSSDGGLRLWELNHGDSHSGGSGVDVTKIIPAHKFAVSSNCFNIDGSLIASGDTSGTIKVFSCF